MTSQDDESKFIEHWKKARKFDPKSVSDWLELGIKSVVFVGMLAAGARYVLPVVAPNWAELPQNVQNNTATLEVITNQLTSDTPQILEFRGLLIPGQRIVQAGDTINMAMVIRRNTSCDTIIRVQFYDHVTNTIASRQTYDIPSVKASVSLEFDDFAFKLFIPQDLPDGLYSYFPEIIPIDCGVYETVIPPMSLPFNVISNATEEN